MWNNMEVVDMELCSPPNATPPLSPARFEDLDVDTQEENVSLLLTLMKRQLDRTIASFGEVRITGSGEDEDVEVVEAPRAPHPWMFETSGKCIEEMTSPKFLTDRLDFIIAAGKRGQSFASSLSLEMSDTPECRRFVAWVLCFPQQRPRHLILTNAPGFSLSEVLLLVQNTLFDPWARVEGERSFLRLVLHGVVRTVRELIYAIVEMAEKCVLEVTADPVLGYMCTHDDDKKILHSCTDVAEYVDLEDQARRQRKNFQISLQIVRPTVPTCTVSLRFYDEALIRSRNSELHIDVEVDTRERRRVTFNDEVREISFEEEGMENARPTSLILERLFPVLYLPRRN